jgi:hypothetical protein
MSKYCRDCKHIKEAHRETFEKCGAMSEENVVTGEMKNLYCSTARGVGFACGPEGNLWELLVEIKVLEHAAA